VSEHENANFIQLNTNTLNSARRQFTIFLSLFVILGVFWSLKLTGITLAGEAFCGQQEHRHSEECLVGSLICELSEAEEHVHDESCIIQTLICEQEEAEPHVHNEDCLNKELICTEEQTGHTHDDSCRPLVLICTNEQEDHVHSDECFALSTEEEFICGQEEAEGHIHGEE